MHFFCTILLRNDRLRPGAFGWGESTASEVSNAFYMLTQITPVFGAIIADRKLGRYSVLRVSFGIYLFGAVRLFVSSLPRVFDHGAGPGKFIRSTRSPGIRNCTISFVQSERSSGSWCFRRAQGKSKFPEQIWLQGMPTLVIRSLAADKA